MQVNSKSKAVRHAIQCFAEVCRKCKRSADVCEFCEVGVARSALEHITPVEVQYGVCTNCGEELGEWDRYCKYCGSPLVGRKTKWE